MGPLFLAVTLVHAGLALAAPQDLAPAPSLSARVDPRIELFAIVFRLAGNPEYSMVRVPAYNEAIHAHFLPYADHPAVQMARRLRSRRGVSYDAVMSMAIHVADVHTLALLTPLNAPGVALDQRWPRGGVGEFLGLMRAFVRDADVAGFLAAQAPLYAEIERQMEATLESHADVTWFERFFGESPQGGFEVVLSPAAGGGNYGPRYVAPDGRQTVYAILGVWMTDEAGNPDIDGRVVPTLVHEFSHSFVNHNIDAHRGGLAGAGQVIYRLVEERMKPQAYGNWITLLSEAMVRAATVRYVLEDEGEDAARRVVLLEQARGFIALDELVDLLGEYEADRVRYPSLASFMPRLVAWLDDLAPRAATVHQAFEASRPRVTATEPADGAAAIDAAVTGTIVVHFDRRMGSGRSVTAPEGQERSPGIDDFEWSDDGTMLTLRVRLVRGREYVLGFNTAWGGGFRDTAGIPAAAFTLRFSTR